MPASVKNATLSALFDISEDPGSAPSGLTYRPVFNLFNQRVALDDTATTPTAKKLAVYQTTISGGLTDIDLTAAQGTNGNVDGTGLKVIGILVFNPTASMGNVTLAAGATNPYALVGAQTMVVGPGGFDSKYFASGNAAVSATVKMLRLTGTNGDTPKVAVLLG